jgi:hypothetical protein
MSGGKRVIATGSAALTLTAADSGSIINLTKGAAYDVTMPAPTTPGLEFTFIGGAVIANLVRIDCGAGLLDGHYVDATPEVTTTAGSRYLGFTGTSVIGDRAVFLSDGTHWKVVGTTGAAAGMAFT